MHRSRRLSLLFSPLVIAACSGGTINATLTLPKPGYIRNDPQTLEAADGIVVDARDKSAVCERIRVRLYTSASAPGSTTAPPDGLKPVAEGRGIGAYSASDPRCGALVVNLAPRDDYWMVVEYPAHAPGDPDTPYYMFGLPSLSSPKPMLSGFYPVKVVDKQTTKLEATFVPPRRTP